MCHFENSRSVEFQRMTVVFGGLIKINRSHLREWMKFDLEICENIFLHSLSPLYSVMPLMGSEKRF